MAHETIVPFSMLALGGKFKYKACVKGHERVYVKISNDRTGGCIAEWNEKNLISGWFSQGIYSLNDFGEDIDIIVVG